MVKLTLPTIISLENTLNLDFNLIFSQSIQKICFFYFKSGKGEPLKRQSLTWNHATAKLTLPAILSLENTLNLHFYLIFGVCLYDVDTFPLPPPKKTGGPPQFPELWVHHKKPKPKPKKTKKKHEKLSAR